jgi:hypothetical protein
MGDSAKANWIQVEADLAWSLRDGEDFEGRSTMWALLKQKNPRLLHLVGHALEKGAQQEAVDNFWRCYN